MHCLFSMSLERKPGSSCWQDNVLETQRGSGLAEVDWESSMEFREVHDGIRVSILVDSTTGTCIGQLIDVPGSPLIEAGSYDEMQEYLKQAVKDYLSGSTADFLGEWKRAVRRERASAERHARQQAALAGSPGARSRSTRACHTSTVEFRERYDGISAKVRFDGSTGTYIGELVDIPGAPLIEAGSYEEIRAHLQRVARERFPDSAVDFLKEWKRANHLEKVRSGTRAEDEAA